ncbi:hypothetical protein TWF694_003527 [Orbilia ellipsospora]|uniref:Uncharacterized protein n=1 Tax=Orbilia ellipsospora TaxID=2528407 RepID=A0AAV9X0X6_9PEZI
MTTINRYSDQLSSRSLIRKRDIKDDIYTTCLSVLILLVILVALVLIECIINCTFRRFVYRKLKRNANCLKEDIGPQVAVPQNGIQALTETAQRTTASQVTPRTGNQAVSSTLIYPQIQPQEMQRLSRLYTLPALALPTTNLSSLQEEPSSPANVSGTSGNRPHAQGPESNSTRLQEGEVLFESPLEISADTRVLPMLVLPPSPPIVSTHREYIGPPMIVMSKGGADLEIVNDPAVQSQPRNSRVTEESTQSSRDRGRLLGSPSAGHLPKDSNNQAALALYPRSPLSSNTQRPGSQSIRAKPSTTSLRNSLYSQTRNADDERQEYLHQRSSSTVSSPVATQQRREIYYYC